MTKILILSGTASAVNYKRALGSITDVTLFVTDSSSYAAVLYEPDVTPFVVPLARNIDEYRKALDFIIRKHSIDVLIPTSDHDMEGVMQLLKNGWDPPVSMFKPDFDAYHKLTHKGDLIRSLNKLEMKLPKLYNSLDEVHFPIVLKPPREGGSKGVWILNDQDRLIKKYQEVTRVYGEDVVLQEYIPGGAGSIYLALLLFDQKGGLRGEVTSRSTSTFMSWGGGGVSGEIVDEPELLEMAKEIIAACGGWQGPVNLEFKKHADTGVFYLMEVNCRLNGYSYLTSMNGLNFPKAIIELLTNGNTEFLSSDTIEQRKNFVLSFRETHCESFLGKKH
ncbi:ATP-grasp domain-containing protein [Roseivirga sp. E12]|uniref:ATP-grasp domain-containing protein n=1 Tax=Roseivirga sp. E12 TaxID=2819237 RepID=UPI001ABD1BEA|nr:ATP-grasp domain-containing protein [Roseivirga sp. E12]MBO3697274.1 ATP-grasp domain-containing protein [Roseivirga sp. E12]